MSSGWKPKPRTFKTKLVRVQQTDPIASRVKYGLNDATATADQLKARYEDGYTGQGAYRRGRKRRYGTMVLRAPRGRIMRYGGRGMYTGGRGSFWTDLWDKSAGLRKQGGDWLRGGGGGDWGKAAGYASQALGTGAYTVKNALVDGGGESVVPNFSSPAEDGVVISGTEFVQDIYAPAAAGIFSTQTFALNPALVNVFPWLSQVASNYEEYEFLQLIFTFKSSISALTSTTNGQVGSVIMATQYNPADPPFKNKLEMMHYSASQSCQMTENMIHGCECDPSKNSGAPGKYIRAGPVEQGEDVKTYDLGTLNLAVANCPAAFVDQAVGELHVSYTVRLRKQRFFSTLGSAIPRDCFIGRTPTSGGVAPDACQIGVGQQNRLGGQLSFPGHGQLQYTLPAGIGGNIRIRVAFMDATTAGGSAAVVIHEGVPTITEIMDVPYTTATAVTQWQNEIGGYGSGTGVGCHESHWNVITPASAGSTQPNSWLIDLTFGGTISTTVSSFIIDVEVYNTAFNLASSGHLIVQDINTGLVIPWN